MYHPRYYRCLVSTPNSAGVLLVEGLPVLVVEYYLYTLRRVVAMAYWCMYVVGDRETWGPPLSDMVDGWTLDLCPMLLHLSITHVSMVTQYLSPSLIATAMLCSTSTAMLAQAPVVPEHRPAPFRLRAGS